MASAANQRYGAGVQLSHRSERVGREAGLVGFPAQLLLSSPASHHPPQAFHRLRMPPFSHPCP